jgi:hemerythrin-like domain-containing protein
MKATQQLKDDHESILIMISVLEKISYDLESGKTPDTEQCEKIIDFIKVFADKSHHGKEEEYLFPAMENHGFSHDNGPIAVMLDEHEQGRSYIKNLNSSLIDFKNGNKDAVKGIISNSRGYAFLLRNHIEKENNILFSMADKVINENEQFLLYETFVKIEKERIGSEKQEEFQKLLKTLQTIYLS